MRPEQRLIDKHGPASHYASLQVITSVSLASFRIALEVQFSSLGLRFPTLVMPSFGGVHASQRHATTFSAGEYGALRFSCDSDATATRQQRDRHSLALTGTSASTRICHYMIPILASTEKEMSNQPRSLTRRCLVLDRSPVF